MSQFNVYANWDAEAGVWVAQSDDFPGLVAEAATMDELKSKLRALANELIGLNGIQLGAEGGQLVIHSEERVAVAA